MREKRQDSRLLLELDLSLSQVHVHCAMLTKTVDDNSIKVCQSGVSSGTYIRPQRLLVGFVVLDGRKV